MEALLVWLEIHKETLQTVSIAVSIVSLVVGLAVTFHTFRKEARIRRLNNWLHFTEQHKDIWKMSLELPGLTRIRDPHANLDLEPLTSAEQHFVGILLKHLDAVRKAVAAGMLIAPEGLAADVREFFSFPVPLAVWRKVKHLQDRDFVAFLDSYLNGSQLGR